MTDIWDDEYVSAAERNMTPEEAELADHVYAAIQRQTSDSDRSLQSKAFVLGVSELGTCQERTRRLLAGVPEEEGDKFEAFLGTAIGDHVEDAILKAASLFPGALRHELVEVELTADGGVYTLFGHPDIILPGWGVLDVKTTFGLEVVRRTGASRQQRFQRNLYTLGAAQVGLLDIPLGQARTANVWLDRSGKTKDSFAEVTTYDEDVVTEATQWLDEVVYNYRQGTEAQKEPPRNWCQAVCGHFNTCRQYDTDVSGLILDPEVVTATLIYDEARAMEKRGRVMKEEAKAVLEGLDGYVNTDIGRFQIRTTQKAGSTYTVTRKPGVQIDVRRMKD